MNEYQKTKTLIHDTLRKILANNHSERSDYMLIAEHCFSSTLNYYQEAKAILEYAKTYIKDPDTPIDERTTQIIERMSKSYRYYHDAHSIKILDWLLKMRISWMYYDTLREAVKIIGFPDWLCKSVEKNLLENEKLCFKIIPEEQKWWDCTNEAYGYTCTSREDEIRDTWIMGKYDYPELFDVVPGHIILDIGAYKGETALWYAHKINRHGAIYACEMIPSNIGKLTNNIIKNNLQNIIEVVPCGIGYARKSRYTEHRFDAINRLEEYGEKSIIVMTIDQLISKKNLPNVDWIKMDIEGGECDALDSAYETIKKYKPNTCNSSVSFSL